MSTNTQIGEDAPNLRLGLFCAFGILLIWSGFLVFSRAGVKTALTPEDLTALRFVVAGACTAPFVWQWWPRHLPLHVKALLALTGPGVLYGLAAYYGLNATSAAYGGIFTNGTVPIFTVLVVLLVTGALPSRGQAMALVVIMAGGAMFALPSLVTPQGGLLLGIMCLLAASLLVSVYIFALKHWRVTPRQALALVNIPNAVVFLPIWYFYLPSGMAEPPMVAVVFQALYQGLGPGFAAVILFALTARHLGPTATAGFSAAVPATAALLAIPVLAEVPTALEWAGILVVTAGLGMLVAVRS